WLVSDACPRPVTFPYTTLFRSQPGAGAPAPETAAQSRGTPHEFAHRLSLTTGRATARRARQPARRSVRPWPQSRARSSWPSTRRSEEHTSELQSRENLVCRLLL